MAKFKFGGTVKFCCSHMHCALVLAMFCASMLAACAKSGAPSSAAALIAAPIHGVNHTAEPFSFLVIDPQNPKNAGGGEIINAYGAGGTMCCYLLPAKWRPGLKVEIAETHWLPMKADQTLPEVKKKHVVEVPAYQGGEVGALWVLRGPGGEMTVVSSGVQPDHQYWPGKVKGWPVPSIEYQRVFQDQIIADAQITVDVYVSSLNELINDLVKHALEEWNSNKTLQPERIKPFKGPRDSDYLAMLKEEYENELAIARDKLIKEKAARP